MTSNRWCGFPHICDALTYTVVGFLSRLVQNGVGLDNVINYIALRNLFGAKLLRGRQVFPVIVAKVIVTDNGRWLKKRKETFLF